MSSEIKETVLEVANEVYAELRGGHDESVYHQAMAYEFRLRDIPYKVEDTVEVLYKDEQRVGTRRLDFMVVAKNDLVIELKAKEAIGPIVLSFERISAQCDTRAVCSSTFRPAMTTASRMNSFRFECGSQPPNPSG